MGGRLEGKVAFITGAARGQGRSNALRLAAEGARIIGVDICRQLDSVHYPLATAADLAETVRLVTGCGGEMVAQEADVRDYDALAAAVAAGIARFGRLDIVNANAGISCLGSVQDMTASAWRDVLDVNLTGAWQTVRAAAPRLVAGGRGGAVVLTDSVAGLLGRANASAYVASKHGMVGLMRTLALELAPDMIRVNCINPTQVDTPMIMNDMTKRRFVPGPAVPTLEEFSAVSRGLHALPVPWVEPTDVSEALLFLVSDAARYITGVTLPVDAGASLL